VDTKAKIGLGVGGAVLALGAAVGVGALAASIGGTDAATAQTGRGQDGTSGNRGTGARGGTDTAALARTLAGKLGVDETTMASALEEVMATNRPAAAPSGRPSGQPSGAPSGTGRAGGRGPGGSAYVETMAKALATRLNLDEAKVLAALQEAMPAQR